MKFGSLFAGIGGLDLGLERAGMSCAWQVEIDDYCQKVLTKHWPDVPKHRDIREVDFEQLGRVDLICGGFPCQDLSSAGKGAGLSGARSGLWSEYKRAVRVVRPRYVLVENVPGLLSRGMGVVLGDLAELGYDCEWQSLPAAAFGAPHLRWRVFIVAHALQFGYGADGKNRTQSSDRRTPDRSKHKSDAVGHTDGEWQQQSKRSIFEKRGWTANSGWWTVEPDVGRVAHGVSRRMDRLRGLGNAVVPQIGEWIGERIMEFDSE